MLGYRNWGFIQEYLKIFRHLFDNQEKIDYYVWIQLLGMESDNAWKYEATEGKRGWAAVSIASPVNNGRFEMRFVTYNLHRIKMLLKITNTDNN